MKSIFLSLLFGLSIQAQAFETSSGSDRARELSRKRYVSINLFSTTDQNAFSTKLSASNVSGIGDSFFSSPSAFIRIKNPMILLKNGKWAYLPKEYCYQICDQLRLGPVPVLGEPYLVTKNLSLFDFTYKVAEFRADEMVEGEETEYLAELSCQNNFGRRNY